jgi:rubrerythrin
MDNVNKQQLISEFETMKLVEQDAHDFYIKASQDPSVKNERIRNCFTKIAEDERYHIELVDRIINTVKNCLCPVD